MLRGLVHSLSKCGGLVGEETAPGTMLSAWKVRLSTKPRWMGGGCCGQELLPTGVVQELPQHGKGMLAMGFHPCFLWCNGRKCLPPPTCHSSLWIPVWTWGGLLQWILEACLTAGLQASPRHSSDTLLTHPGFTAACISEAGQRIQSYFWSPSSCQISIFLCLRKHNKQAFL